MVEHNWAGNVDYGAANLHNPTTVAQVQSIVAASTKARGLGSRHSFNTIADTTGDLISLSSLERSAELDTQARTITVDGGIKYGELATLLHEKGWALANLASLPHISAAGACATATHGSGDRIGNLATIVSGLEVVVADGEIVRLARESDPDAFKGAVVSLGGLGVVTSLTLDLQPTFQMRQDLYEYLPLARLVDHFDEITSSADSVSLFTDWRGRAFDQVWLKRRVPDGDTFEPPPDFFGATKATVPIHPIRRMPTAALTEQLGVPGPWHERMPHFRMDQMPSSGAEIQTEYLIPRDRAAEALLAVDAIRDRFSAPLQISEVRTIAADELWMSTAYGRASVALHFTWLPDWEAVRSVLPSLEAALAPFEPRPHWGKVFTIPAEAIRSAYEKLPQFAGLLERYDPAGKFRNAFLNRYIFGGS